ncbi:MAG: DEAD/DEAH box helicase, partial [Terriglobia bacterium]
MDVSEIKKEFKSDRHYRGQIVSETVVEASAPRFGKLNAPLSSSVKESLLRAGTDRLYTHQAGAANAVREGNNVVVVTGTASGKSLCYNIPVLEAVENDKRSKALYLFPTKALAQDQLKALGAFRLEHVVAATYDGDTPARDRRTIRDDANIVLSNFDMLHYGILPYHSRWGSFLMNCRFVVIDEMHTLRGVYGSNCANVLARLRRVLDRYMART